MRSDTTLAIPKEMFAPANELLPTAIILLLIFDIVE